MTLIPHLAFPMRFTSTGKAVVVEQDSIEEISGCVETILRTTKGERLERPDFGIRDITFEQVRAGAAAQHIERAVLAQEPRAQLLVTEDTSDFADMIWTVRASLTEASQNG